MNIPTTYGQFYMGLTHPHFRTTPHTTKPIHQLVSICACYGGSQRDEGHGCRVSATCCGTATDASGLLEGTHGLEETFGMLLFQRYCKIVILASRLGGRLHDLYTENVLKT